MRVATVSRPCRADWLPRAIISGFIAAIAMLFTFILAYGLAYLVARIRPVGSDQSVLLIRNWFQGLTHNSLTDLAGTNLYAVAGLHFFIAIIWAALYAYYAEPRLDGSAWLRGVRFSLLPWALSIALLLPLGGGGILGLGLGAGPLPIFGNLILHLAYGATLGAVYGPLGDISADSFRGDGGTDDFETTHRSEVRTAGGIVAGLVLGLALSAIVAAALHATPEAPILTVPQAAFVLGSMLLGGAFGAFVGAFAGLTEPR